MVKDDERLHVRIRAAPRHSDGRRTSAETSAEDLERHHDFPPAHGAALWYRFHDDVGAATTDTLVTARRKGVRARFGEADGATLLCGRPFAKPRRRRWSSRRRALLLPSALRRPASSPDSVAATATLRTYGDLPRKIAIPTEVEPRLPTAALQNLGAGSDDRHDLTLERAPGIVGVLQRINDVLKPIPPAALPVNALVLDTDRRAPLAQFAVAKNCS